MGKDSDMNSLELKTSVLIGAFDTAENLEGLNTLLVETYFIWNFEVYLFSCIVNRFLSIFSCVLC